jgi:hypothetical protein
MRQDRRHQLASLYKVSADTPSPAPLLLMLGLFRERVSHSDCLAVVAVCFTVKRYPRLVVSRVGWRWRLENDMVILTELD